MKINDTVIVLDGNSGEIIQIGKLESLELEFFLATYVVDGQSYETMLSLGCEDTKYVVITEEQLNEALRDCGSNYVQYCAHLMRFMMRKISHEDYSKVIDSLINIDNILSKYVDELGFKSHLDSMKRICNLNPDRPEQYNIAKQICTGTLKKNAEKIGTRIK